MNSRRCIAVISFLSLLLLQLFSAQSLAQSKKLQRLNINPDLITISGVSAGAFMAVQMHVTYSQIFSGVGSVAGGIYWCSHGESFFAPSTCMQSPEQLEVDQYLEHARSEEKAGMIDSLTNLKNSRIYIYGSPDDRVVKAVASDKLGSFYEAFLPKENIKFRRDFKSAHGWPTLNYGNACSIQGLPWMQNCKFDMAGEMLSHLYTGLKNPPLAIPPEVPPAAPGNATALHNLNSAKVKTSAASSKKLDALPNLFQFEQKEFGGGEVPLYPTGWVYIPTACQKGAACGLHMTLHGCKMNPDDVQDQFAVHSGLNSWAETNNIVILYPQTDRMLPSNPFGCWDWYGYTGPDFANKKGAQMQALKKMVDRVSGSRYGVKH